MFHTSRVVFFLFLLARYANAGIISRARSISLNGHPYNVEPLSDAIRGAHSDTYDILEDFLPPDSDSGVPAILKVISHHGDSSEQVKIQKEIEYLKKVRLLLFTIIDNAAFYIVMRNVRKVVPPLKPYHEWYLEDSSRNLDNDLKKLQENIEKKLIMYTGPGWDICYGDLQFLNIYVDKTLETVMPIDWGVGDYVWGVKEVADVNEIEECKEYLWERIPEMFGCEELEEVLARSNNKLWPGDERRRICTEKGREGNNSET